MEKYKESTARIVMFREFGVINSFTLENSFLKNVIISNNNESIKTNKNVIVENTDKNKGENI